MDLQKCMWLNFFLTLLTNSMLNHFNKQSSNSKVSQKYPPVLCEEKTLIHYHNIVQNNIIKSSSMYNLFRNVFKTATAVHHQSLQVKLHRNMDIWNWFLLFWFSVKLDAKQLALWLFNLTSFVRHKSPYRLVSAAVCIQYSTNCSMYSVYMKNLGVGNCSMYSVFYKLRKAQDVIKTSS